MANIFVLQEEIYLMSNSIPIVTARKIAKFIISQMRRYHFVDQVVIIDTSIRAIEKALPKFDETKGNLYTFLTKSIRFALQQYFRKESKQPIEPIEPPKAKQEVSLDGLTNEDLIHLYKNTFTILKDK